MTPRMIWEGFDPALPAGAEFTEKSKTPNDGFSVVDGVLDALSADDGVVSVFVRTFLSEKPNDTMIILASDYRRLPDTSILEVMANLGYDAMIPNLDGRMGTSYPPSLRHGDIDRAPRPATPFVPATETATFLYARIMRRMISFAERYYPNKKIIMCGVGAAADVAFMTAGMDTRVAGLFTVNGGSYKEYLPYQKYGGAPQPVLSEEFMAWMSGVAAAAYAKLVTCPTIIFASTNGHKTDPDRAENAVALFKKGVLHVDISPRAMDFIDHHAFSSMLVWLSAVRSNGFLPEMPEISAHISEEGALYLTATVDTSAMIDGVDFYYSTGEYNHLLREWSHVDGLQFGANEYTARPAILDTTQPLFAYARVRYSNGFTLSSVLHYQELGGKNVVAASNRNRRVIYNPDEGESTFSIVYKGDILRFPAVEACTIHSGARGVRAKFGYLKSYKLGSKTTQQQEMLLLIDMHCETDTDVTVVLCGYKDRIMTRYAADIRVAGCGGYFVRTQFSLQEFVDERLKSPESWREIKTITFEAQGLTIGNMLFI